LGEEVPGPAFLLFSIISWGEELVASKIRSRFLNSIPLLNEACYTSFTCFFILDFQSAFSDFRVISSNFCRSAGL